MDVDLLASLQLCDFAVDNGGATMTRLEHSLRWHIDTLRQKNDSPALLDRDTQFLRGRIAALDDLLNAIEDARAVATAAMGAYPPSTQITELARMRSGSLLTQRFE